jgi:metal-responsive CopG/Arc/MetJ family transcriptional regulator
VAKIAISLPDSLFEAVEAAREVTGETRSEFLRRAAEQAIRKERDREQVRRYVEAYRRMPETEEEIQSALAVSGVVFAENPWEEEERDA